jgi:hypothetical protein
MDSGPAPNGASRNDIIFIDEESPASVACDTPKQKKDQLSLVPNGLKT